MKIGYIMKSTLLMTLFIMLYISVLSRFSEIKINIYKKIFSCYPFKLIGLSSSTECHRGFVMNEH